jgi:ubiquinone/menaquinone biosynthesis C-methylase UbiE
MLKLKERYAKYILDTMGNFLRVLPFSYFSQPELIKRFVKGQTVLDAGCGSGELMIAIRQHPKFSVGLDVFVKDLKRAKAKRTHDEYACCDARYLCFRDCCFDMTISIEVLEHIPKRDGMQALRELERVSKHRIIITTPIGFLSDYMKESYPGQAHVLSTLNPFMKHVSGWDPGELKQLGFQKIYGVAPKYYYAFRRSPRKSIRSYIRRFVSFLFLHFSSPFTFHSLSLAESMICVKDLTADL